MEGSPDAQTPASGLPALNARGISGDAGKNDNAGQRPSHLGQVRTALTAWPFVTPTGLRLEAIRSALRSARTARRMPRMTFYLTARTIPAGLLQQRKPVAKRCGGNRNALESREKAPERISVAENLRRLCQSSEASYRGAVTRSHPTSQNR
jgi:hypothetical protein